MKLPQMVSNVDKIKKYIIDFGGINQSCRFNEGELADSKNLSSDLLPFISQRGKREQLGKFDAPTAVHAHNGIAVVDGTKFLYKADGEEEFTEKITVTEGKKQIAQLNNIILIYPDKVYCDVSNVNNVITKPLEATVELVGRRSHYSSSSLYYYFSEIYHNRIVAYDVTAADGIKVNGEWYENYCAKELYEKFSAGDIVTIPRSVYYYSKNTSDNSHIYIGANDVRISYVERSDKKTTLYFADSTFWDKGTSYSFPYLTQDISISKTAANLDYVCESGGRVWGTSENTIKASAYNDIKSFSRFEGLSSDSFSISVSTQGEFTGCAAFTSHLVFFKENYIHRIYGSRPANFNLVTSSAPGVQAGSYASIKMLNERLFYKGVDGVYMYSGGMPVKISEGLGTEVYTDAVAGVFGNKYYISMKNSDGIYKMFSYDTHKGVFLREDDTQMIDTTQKDGALLYIDSDGRMMAITGNRDTDGIEWSAELREFNETVNEKKGYSRLTLRIELDEGAYMNTELALDDGRFNLAKTVNRRGRNIVSINIPPNRCDSFKIRLSGKGGCRVMNLVREFITQNGVR